MSKVIIGIHGLGKKPCANVLKDWWKKSINEGFELSSLHKQFLKFEFAYWADILYMKCLDPSEKDESAPLFVEEPYVYSKDYDFEKQNEIRKTSVSYFKKQLNKLMLNEIVTGKFPSLTDFILDRYFRDLNIYYSDKILTLRKKPALAREVIRDRLAEILRKNKHKEILLVAHSMGSIIAFDVLTHTVPNIKINTLITLGSPLGVPIVQNKIKSELNLLNDKKKKLCIPDNIVGNWYNFYDKDDSVATHYAMEDKFEKNSRDVKIIEEAVYNNYEVRGKINPHKSFGYLRSEEFIEVVYEFLNRGRSKLMIWFDKKINRIIK